LFFRNGAPFEVPLTGAARDLDDMRLIRDCIAHKSHLARENLGKLVQRRTGVANRFSPGRFLLKTVTGAAETHLEYFSRILTLTADQLTA